jgi:hypothetical protein
LPHRGQYSVAADNRQPGSDKGMPKGCYCRPIKAYWKLGIRSRTELTRIMLANGITD